MARVGPQAKGILMQKYLIWKNSSTLMRLDPFVELGSNDQFSHHHYQISTQFIRHDTHTQPFSDVALRQQESEVGV